MALLDRFLARAITRGPLTLIHADGKAVVFGTPDPALRPVTIRLAPGAAAAIMREPGLGMAEAYMDGRAVIEQGEIC
jgi:cyclopropane-fatty-acyl-phospholipid synthase